MNLTCKLCAKHVRLEELVWGHAKPRRGSISRNRPTEARLWSLGVCITHRTVDAQSEQHEEEDSSPGRGQRECGDCFQVDDEDQSGSYRQKPSSLPQACSLLPPLSHLELTTATSLPPDSLLVMVGFPWPHSDEPVPAVLRSLGTLSPQLLSFCFSPGALLPENSADTVWGGPRALGTWSPGRSAQPACTLLPQLTHVHRNGRSKIKTQIRGKDWQILLPQTV